MYTLIIRNGKVVDGGGNPWFKADVGVVGDTIRTVGRLGRERADVTIDAEGMVVSPGFIDIHSHSDTVFLANPKAVS